MLDPTRHPSRPIPHAISIPGPGRSLPDPGTVPGVAEHDAIVVGSGPNGLVAAVTLAAAGWKVLVLEAAQRPGGGTRSAELIRPGVVHDVCSAIHPLGIASPALRELPLQAHGLEWVHPELPLAHPLDGGRAALQHRCVGDTAAALGADAGAYHRLYGPLADAGFDLTDGVLSPLRVPPKHPVALARFGLLGLRSAAGLARRRFDGVEAQALLAGLGAHSVLSLSTPLTAAYGLMLGTLGHTVGWPVARGGSQRIADALVSLLVERGGRVECGVRVGSLDELAPSRAVLLDVSPRQAVAIAGHRLPRRYAERLCRFRHGPGVFKLDWVLDGPVPWTNPDVARAASVHVGGSLEQIAAAEDEVARGRIPERPFVLLAQPSAFDPTRARGGEHVLWGYCHVPARSGVDMTAAIEAQIERFAPGFRDRVVGRHAMGPAALEDHDANLVGGDVTGGAGDLRQVFARPTLGLHPWATPVRGLYLCSASTPPGGGVHGMCGWHAANEVLRRHPD